MIHIRKTTTAIQLHNKQLANKNLSVESEQSLGRPYLTHLSTWVLKLLRQKPFSTQGKAIIVLPKDNWLQTN